MKVKNMSARLLKVRGAKGKVNIIPLQEVTLSKELSALSFVKGLIEDGSLVEVKEVKEKKDKGEILPEQDSEIL